MIIESTNRVEEMTGSSNRVFGLVFAGLFAFVSLSPLFSGASLRPWAMWVSAVFFTTGLLLPGALSVPNRLWMQLGLILSKIVSPIALGIVYFSTLVPIGILMRVLGKDPLRLKFEPQAESYWIKRVPPGPDPQFMKRQF